MNFFIRQLANNRNTQILVGLLWSFSSLIVKDLTANNNLDIFFISAVRSLFGILFLLPLIFIKWEPEQTPDLGERTQLENGGKIQHKPVHSIPIILSVMLFGAAALASNTFLLCWAFQHTDALTPIFMHYGGVLLVAPASIYVLHHTPTKREWIATALTLVGTTALVFHGLKFDQPVIILVSLGVGLTQLCGQLSLGWLGQNDEALQKETLIKRAYGGKCFMLAEIMTVVVGLTVSASTTSSSQHLNSRSCVMLLLLGVFTWALPNFFAILAQRTKPLVALGLLWLCDPIGVATWPILAGQDPLPPSSHWIGAILILVALIIKRIDEAPKRSTSTITPIPVSHSSQRHKSIPFLEEP